MGSWANTDAEEDPLQVQWEDEERVFCRWQRSDANEHSCDVLGMFLAADQPAPSSLTRLKHECDLKDVLDSAWALRPLELSRKGGREVLLFEYQGGEPLTRLIGEPMEIGQFLRLAVSLSVALGRLRERGLIHKDIKPTNVLVNSATSQVWLTGFGVASRVARERQSPSPPEFVAGTLPYMAPEQTGRMN